MLSAPLTNYVQVDTDDLCLQRKLLKQAPIFSLLDQYLAPKQKGKRNGKILLHYISVFLKIVRAEADLQKTQGRFQRTLKSFFQLLLIVLIVQGRLEDSVYTCKDR